MATAIAIMGGVCLMSLGVIAVLSYALFVSYEEQRMKEREGLEPPPVKWDYTVETGWVDAEVEDVEE